MNYYSLRILMILILVVLGFFISYKNGKIKKLGEFIRNYIFFIIIFSLLIFSYDFEKNFITFDSVSESIKYKYPYLSSIDYHTNDNSAIILFEDHSHNYVIEIKKKNDKWEYPSFKYAKMVDNPKTISAGNKNSIDIYKSTEGLILILVTGFDKNDINELNVSDSLDSKFKVFNGLTSERLHIVTKYKFLDSIPNDYKITVNDKEVGIY